MGKVVKMPAASRPEQIASLIPRSRNGTALVPPGRAVTASGSASGASVSSPPKV
jgi:hypothetical protein